MSRENSQRIPHACDRCRLKKIKCNGSVPCPACQLADVVCHFGAKRKKGDKQVPSSYVDQLKGQQAVLVKALKETWRRYVQQSGSQADQDNPSVHFIVKQLGLLKDDSLEQLCDSEHDLEEGLEDLAAAASPSDTSCDEARAPRRSSRASAKMLPLTANTTQNNREPSTYPSSFHVNPNFQTAAAGFGHHGTPMSKVTSTTSSGSTDLSGPLSAPSLSVLTDPTGSSSSSRDSPITMSDTTVSNFLPSTSSFQITNHDGVMCGPARADPVDLGQIAGGFYFEQPSADCYGAPVFPQATTFQPTTLRMSESSDTSAVQFADEARSWMRHKNQAPFVSSFAGDFTSEDWAAWLDEEPQSTARIG